MLRKKLTTLALLLSISLGGILAPISVGIHRASAVPSTQIVFVQLNQVDAALGGFWGGVAKTAIGFLGNVTGIWIAGNVLVEYFWPIMKGLSFLVLRIVAAGAAMAGNFLDYVVQYSLTKNIGGIAAVNVGWGVVRDISNIFLIFILVWIAISTILGLGSFTMQKTLPPLIMVAIFINFSLFATKLIIDSSNIVSLFFYKAAFTACEPSATTHCPTLSSTVMKGTHLQELWDPNLFENSPPADQQIVLYNTFIIIFVAMTLWIFFTTALLLFARLLTFLILMIFAPFAFLSYVLPAMQSQVGGKWWKELTNQALLAPVFFFMFYLISRIINDGVFEFNSANLIGGAGSTLDEATGIFNFFVIIGLVYMTGKIAKQFSSEFGKQMVSWGGAALGFAAGAVTGGVAKIGRGTVGNLGNAGLKSEKLKDMADSKNVLSRFIGKTAIKASKKSSESSMDLRKTSLGGFISKQTGVNFDNKALGAVGLDTAAGKGGYVGEKERKVEKELEFAELLKTKLDDSGVYEKSRMDALKAKGLDDEYKETYKENLRVNKEAHDEEEKNKKTADPEYKVKEFDVKKHKADFDKRYDTDNNVPPPQYTTVADYNKARMDKHIENLKNPMPGGLNFGQALGVGLAGGVIGGFGLKSTLGAAGVLSADNAIQSAAELEAAKRLEKKNKGDTKKGKDIAKNQKKLAEIETTLKGIRGLLARAKGISESEVTDDDIKGEIKRRMEKIDTGRNGVAELEVRKSAAKKAFEANPTNTSLKTTYLDAFKAHKKKVAEQEEYKNLWENKEETEKKLEDLTGKKEEKK